MINLLCISFLLCTLFGGNKNTDEWMVCGDDKVWIIDANQSEGEKVKVLWKWDRSDVADQIPEKYQNYLISMDECKFVGDNRLLLASSSGGVLLVERDTKKCLFYAYAPMAHSVDLLPDNKIAVALSTNPKGNCIEIYDISKPETVLFRDSLYSGHGSVWMEKRNRYYALGFDELREYSLQNWNTDKPELKLERKWTIPQRGGHDLTAISDHEFLVSGHRGVSVFNIDEEKFTPFEPLADVKSVKSVNYNKNIGRLIYTKAEESWWTFNLYQQNPDKVITIPEIKLYKVRPNW